MGLTARERQYERKEGTTTGLRTGSQIRKGNNLLYFIGKDLI